MIVQYASDLHLDYGQNYEYILNKGFEEEGNVLILAGDVANLVALRTYRLFWDLCSSNFEKTIFVPGNHDYYGEWEKVEDLIEPIKIPIRPNVLCCNNEVVRVGDTDFICSTLWSNIIPEQSAAVNSILLDFNEITVDGRKISVDEYVAMHKESLAFLQEAVAGSDAKHIVVVTHHVPSYTLCREDHKHSPISSGFVTELGNWIADSRIEYWIYGHSHTSIEGTIGKTKLVSNQLGYLALNEGEDYSPCKTFLI